MKRLLMIGLLIFFNVSFGAYSKTDWLILINIAANNNLYSWGLTNIRQLQKYGSNSRARVVVQMIGTGGYCNRYLVGKGRSRLLANLGRVDSSKKASLSSFLTYGIKTFPANKRAAIIWDHGSGYVNDADFSVARSICYDETHDSWMNVAQLREALQTTYQATRKKLDILGFDACLMQMVELTTLLASYATYIVASQETIPDDGFNYTAMLKPFQTRTVSVVNFAKQWVSDYRAYYQPLSDNYSLSAINIANMLLFERNINTVAGLLKSCLNKQVGTTVASTLYDCLFDNSVVHFEIYSYIDIGRWYQTVLANLSKFEVTDSTLKTRLDTALRAGLRLLSSAVVANTAARSAAGALGLSICYPSYVMYSSYARSSFASRNAWVSFVNSYLNQQRDRMALVKELAWRKKFLKNRLLHAGVPRRSY